ncbi:hypothetical protein ACJQWK_07105 [Exserohilum turcicum]|uniref:Uncharacterized protein n=1 Tax=Exserohilum turcicum (strain 28A) TaxID=671987 RepID=R0K5L6_EXST2|nr:uncharacterized protein SETTUDRAFT_32053 [Exserohilum turcica Et28A]EOA84814.1 hypothetical protein SETTUDRAFT_32053 [Exserohilum turcica Et28A]
MPLSTPVAVSDYGSSFSIPASLLGAMDEHNKNVDGQDRNKDASHDSETTRWSWGTSIDETMSNDNGVAEQDQYSAGIEEEEQPFAFAQDPSPSEYKPSSSRDRSYSSDDEEVVATALLGDSMPSKSEASLTPNVPTNCERRRSERIKRMRRI